MVKFTKAKELFTHIGANFQQAYEGATEKGRRKCFSTNNAILEIWKHKNRNRPLSVRIRLTIIN